jgi:hypothetical protein
MTGDEMTRGRNDRNEMTGDKMKGDESKGNRHITIPGPTFPIAQHEANDAGNMEPDRSGKDQFLPLSTIVGCRSELRRPYRGLLNTL